MSLQRVLLFGICCVAIVDRPTAFGETLSQRTKCHNVRAKLVVVRVSANCSSPVDFCSAGTIAGGGIVNGALAGNVLGLAPGAGLPGLVPSSTLSFVAVHTIETARGILTMLGTGVFDTARGEFAEIDPVTSGTGVFQGATGTLWLTGTSSDGGVSFAGDVIGQVCVARSRQTEDK